MVAIFMSPNNETAAMFVSQTSPVGVELFSYVNAFFRSNKICIDTGHVSETQNCGWFWVHCSPKKFTRTALEATDLCLRLLEESNKSKFYSYSVRNSVLIISHITFQDCRVHIFSDNLHRNSCIMEYPGFISFSNQLHFPKKTTRIPSKWYG